MAKNKIVLITESLKMGGAEKIIASLAHYLKKNNTFQITVISFFNSYDEEITHKLKADGVKVIFLNKRRGLDIKFYQKLRKEIFSLKPEIIHTHSIHNVKYLLPFRANLLLVHTLHNNLNKHCGKAVTTFYYYLFKYFKIIPVNISNELNHRFNKLPGAKVIFNGIEVVHTKETKRDQRQILSVGRLELQKNHELLLHAFVIIKKEIANTKLIIVGNGSRKKLLMKLSSELGISDSVQFLGQRNDVDSLMASSGLFVLSSKWEGMPLVLIEALKNGCPVVTTNVGGTANVVDENVGRLARPEAEDLARKSIEILSNPLLADKMSKNARKKAKNFSAESMTEKYIQFYRKILS